MKPEILIATPSDPAVRTRATPTTQIGATYGQAVTEQLGRPTRVQPQSGTGVLVPLVNSGELDIGFVNTLEMTDAFTGTGTFEGRRQDSIRLVGVMFPIRVGMFVRDDSDMQSLEDLQASASPGATPASRSSRPC
jgi:TRAP-type uncharacterized transport system substrate-binding protein